MDGSAAPRGPIKQSEASNVNASCDWSEATRSLGCNRMFRGIGRTRSTQGWVAEWAGCECHTAYFGFFAQSCKRLNPHRCVHPKVCVAMARINSSTHPSTVLPTRLSWEEPSRLPHSPDGALLIAH